MLDAGLGALVLLFSELLCHSFGASHGFVLRPKGVRAGAPMGALARLRCGRAAMGSLPQHVDVDGLWAALGRLRRGGLGASVGQILRPCRTT